MGLLARLGALWGTGQTPEELQAESQSYDDRLAALQADKQRKNQAYLDYLREEGFDEQSEGGQRALNERTALENAHLNQQRKDTGEIPSSLNQAADEGLAEGSRNVTGFFKGIFDVAGEALGAVLKAVPWWVWLSVAAYLFVTMGGAGLLKRHVVKRFA